MLKYYLTTWNMNKGFQIIISDGDYYQRRVSDGQEYETEIEGKVFGTLGGWSHSGKEHQGFIEPKMNDHPFYDLGFDPSRAEAQFKSEVIKKTIKYIFEKFIAD